MVFQERCIIKSYLCRSLYILTSLSSQNRPPPDLTASSSLHSAPQPFITPFSRTCTGENDLATVRKELDFSSQVPGCKPLQKYSATALTLPHQLDSEQELLSAEDSVASFAASVDKQRRPASEPLSKETVRVDAVAFTRKCPPVSVAGQGFRMAGLSQGWLSRQAQTFFQKCPSTERTRDGGTGNVRRGLRLKYPIEVHLEHNKECV